MCFSGLSEGLGLIFFHGAMLLERFLFFPHKLVVGAFQNFAKGVMMQKMEFAFMGMAFFIHNRISIRQLVREVMGRAATLLTHINLIFQKHHPKFFGVGHNELIGVVIYRHRN